LEPKRVVELSSKENDTHASWLSADGCRIVVEQGGSVKLAIKPK
jgi:hypothetical protein